ncbi:MAG: hypothetical protein ACKO2L_04280, partial [Planctomycetaceae bacterium]
AQPNPARQPRNHRLRGLSPLSRRTLRRAVNLLQFRSCGAMYLNAVMTLPGTVPDNGSSPADPDGSSVRISSSAQPNPARQPRNHRLRGLSPLSRRTLRRAVNLLQFRR